MIKKSTIYAFPLLLIASSVLFTPVVEAGMVVKPQPTTRTVFKSSGTFTVPYNVSNVDVLVVGGGGGGGDGGGGGGAGGFIYRPSFRVTPSSSISVTVGDGGAGSSNTALRGSSGSNSVFSTITATGGGGGGSNSGEILGGAGGSSGGNGVSSGGGAGVAASPSGQGNAGGGNYTGGNFYGGGGGGGAGAVGGTGTVTAGGNGGVGIASSISGSSVTYAGGGGASIVADVTATAGSGGAGGGGNGASPGAGTAGIANTGGGGGGSQYGNTGGAGGSGVVIVAYNNPDPYWNKVVLLAGNNNGTASSTTFLDQSNSKHKFTTVGNTQWDALYAPTGGGSSILFDGTGDFLKLDGSSDFAFGTGDFTIEFFWRLNVTGAQAILYDSRPLGPVQGLYPTIYIAADNTLRFFQSSADRITGSALTTGQWYHIALTRSGTNTKLFINGTQTGSTYTDSNSYLNGANRPSLGDDYAGANSNGWMSNIRVTKGVARYTANFTPPTLGLPVTVSSSKVIATSTTPGIINATGGTISTTTQAGITYRVHTFTSSGTFQVTSGKGKVWYLVVGGGGGGGRDLGGGGGAGGYRTNGVYNYAVTKGSYTVTVGAGGAAATAHGAGSSGSNSVFDTITAMGGGGGGGSQAAGEAGKTGGSGGGAGGDGSAGFGTGIGGQGNDGGPTSVINGGGGGGGASAAGRTGIGTGNAGGNGGDGTASSITGASVTYAGGGGGAGFSGTPSSGGAGGGGGGAKQNTRDGIAGTDNTGGGGGGGHSGSPGLNPGAGGSGVVIIRYPLSAVTQSNASQNAKVTNGLVGLWSFDNPDMAGVTAYDRSGSGNNGTLTNGPTRTAGKIGQGLRFDGVDDFVDAGDIASADGGSALSVSFWAKQTSLAVNQSFIAKWDYQTDGAWGIQTKPDDSSSLQLFILPSLTDNGGGYNVYTPTGSWSAGVWHHVVFTYPGGAAKVYIDGVSQSLTTTGSPPASMQNSSATVKIGKFGGTLSRYFNGSIDDVRIYNRALSPAEVKQLYNQGR